MQLLQRKFLHIKQTFSAKFILHKKHFSSQLSQIKSFTKSLFFLQLKQTVDLHLKHLSKQFLLFSLLFSSFSKG
jgi:hypothetical protein